MKSSTRKSLQTAVDEGRLTQEAMDINIKLMKDIRTLLRLLGEDKMAIPSFVVTVRGIFNILTDAFTGSEDSKVIMSCILAEQVKKVLSPEKIESVRQAQRLGLI